MVGGLASISWLVLGGVSVDLMLVGGLMFRLVDSGGWCLPGGVGGEGSEVMAGVGTVVFGLRGVPLPASSSSDG